MPAPSGPHPVGTVIVHWTDPSRAEPMAKDAQARRELLVQIWYPARSDKPGEYAPYVPEFDAIFPYRKALSEMGLELLGRRSDRLRSLRTHSLSRADLSGARPRYPVLIFSPGNGVPRFLYTIQMEELASQGYVVAGIDHPYSVAIVAFPDGRVALQPGLRERQPSFEELVTIRTADARFVLDRLKQMDADDPEKRFVARLDLERVGIIGHSLGGVSAVQTCSVDRRFKAAVNLDGGTGEMSDSVQRGIEQPLMLMVKAKPPVSRPTDKQLSAWAMSREQYEALMKKDEDLRAASYGKMRAPGYRVSVKGAQHVTFSDMPLLEGDHNGIDARRALRLIGAYEAAFFNKYLRAEGSPLLDVQAATYPEAILEKFGPGVPR